MYDDVLYDEFNFGRSLIKITDSNILQSSREGEFFNLVDTKQSRRSRSSFTITSDLENDEWKLREELIHLQFLAVSNKGESFERVVTSIIDELANVGGLLEIFIVLGLLTYSLTVKPTRDLDLAVGFEAMKNQICHQEGMLIGKQMLDAEYRQRVNCCFYVNWYVY